MEIQLNQFSECRIILVCMATAVYMAGSQTTSAFEQHDYTECVSPNPSNDDGFGLSIDANESFIVVGAPGPARSQKKELRGAVYLYQRDDDGMPTHVKSFPGPESKQDGRFGVSVALGDDFFAVGSSNHGHPASIHVFQKDYPSIDSWGLAKTVTFEKGSRSDQLLAVRVEEDRIYAGLSGLHSVVVIERTNRNSHDWDVVETILPPAMDGRNRFGYSLDVDGRQMAIGAESDEETGSGQGAVYYFRWTPVGWQARDKLLPPITDKHARFGRAVEISGNWMAVLEGKGGIAIFRRDTELATRKWHFTQFLTGEEDYVSISLGGNELLAGSISTNYNGQFDLGEADMFLLDDESGVWTLAHRLRHKNRARYTWAGGAVHIDENHYVVGSGHRSMGFSGVLPPGSCFLYRKPAQLPAFTPVNDHHNSIVVEKIAAEMKTPQLEIEALLHSFPELWWRVLDRWYRYSGSPIGYEQALPDYVASRTVAIEKHEMRYTSGTPQEYLYIRITENNSNMSHRVMLIRDGALWKTYGAFSYREQTRLFDLTEATNYNVSIAPIVNGELYTYAQRMELASEVEPSESIDKEISNLALAFPEIWWAALNDFVNKSGNTHGTNQSVSSYVASHRIEVEDDETERASGVPGAFVHLRVFDNSSNFSHRIRLMRDGTGWKTYQAYLYKGNSRKFNLTKADAFSPSISPLLDRQLRRYSEGTDFVSTIRGRQAFLQALSTAENLSWLTTSSSVEVNQYVPLLGDGMRGRSFLIYYQNAMLAVSTRHQFNGEIPETVIVDRATTIKLDCNNPFAQDDVLVQIVPYVEAHMTFLGYDPDYALMPNDKLLLPSGESGVIEATLVGESIPSEGYLSSMGQNEVMATMDDDIELQGASGCPVVLASTGKVVGVLTKSADTEDSSLVWFETLCLPKP